MAFPFAGACLLAKAVGISPKMGGIYGGIAALDYL
jgi:hypothetical protein